MGKPTQKTSPLIRIICRLLLPFLLIMTGCAPKSIEHQFYVLPLDESYPPAMELALEWQPDAQLTQVNFSVFEGEIIDHVKIYYLFTSKSVHRFVWISVINSYDSGYQATMGNDGEWLEERPIGESINPASIQLESQQALELIMSYGGNDYIARHGMPGYFMLSLRYLNYTEQNGPIAWDARFANDSHDQLYIWIEDASSKLVKVMAYGEEQKYWLEEITVTENINLNTAHDFFDFFDLRVDDIHYQSGIYSADLTVIAPEGAGFLYGNITRKNLEVGSVFLVADYEITILKINPDSVTIKVMPHTRWYIDPPSR